MIIISAERPGLSPIGKLLNTQDLLMDLLDLIQWDGLIYHIEGLWEGIEERAFAVRIISPDDVDINRIAEGICALAKKYSQEYIGGFNLENDPPRMSTINVNTRGWTPYAIGMSKDKPPVSLYPSWTCIKGMYYFPTAELTISDVFEETENVETCGDCAGDRNYCEECIPE